MANGYSQRTLREIASVVFSRWLTIFLITAIIAGATVVACLVSKKIYRSSVTLWARQGKSSNPLTDTPEPMSRLEVFLKTQHQIILSDFVLRRTLARMFNPSLLQAPPDPAKDESASKSVWQQWYDEVSQKAKAVPANKITRFRKKIKIKTPGGEDIANSEVFTISVEQPAPVQQAQLAAEVLTQEYLVRRRGLQEEVDKSAQELLQQQLDNLRDNVLVKAQKKFNAFIADKVKGNLLDLTQLVVANGEVNNHRIRTLFQEKLFSIDAEISANEALKKELSAQIPAKALKEGADALTLEDLKASSPVVPAKVLANNVIINKLKKKLADLIIERNTLREEYTGKFKLLTQKTGEILSSRRDIISELILELKAIDQHIATLSARRAELQKIVDKKNKIINRLSTLFVEYETLSKEVKLSRSLYDQKRKDLLEAETARQMAQREILITKVDSAALPDPDKPVRPILWLYTLIAVLVGLLLGTGYAFLADSYDHTIRSIDQAERYLGTNVLSSIPDSSGGIVR